MSVLNNSLLLGADAGGGGGYSISRSVRLNSADSAFFSRTPASAGNRKTWTWAGWVKRSVLGAAQELFAGGTGGTDATQFEIGFASSDILFCWGASTEFLNTTQVFRDIGAWYHIVVALDTTQATANNRLKLYVNGSEVTTFSTNNRASLTQNGDFGVNQAALHTIGRRASTAAWYQNGYLADVHFIDGQALTPSSFGEFDTNGIWQPKAFSGGSYGTNGFHLDFADNSAATATTLGKDTSGNGNNWTPNNFSVTAGAGNDSLVDSPTNGTQEDTGVGGEVVGNYCTLNPLANPSGATLSNGNLQLASSAAQNGATAGTIYVNSGKWYWEVTDTTATNALYIGITKDNDTLSSSPGTTAGGYYYIDIGSAYKYNNNNLVSYGATWGVNDVIGVALDMDAGTLTFYKNGTSQGTAYTGLSGYFAPSIGDGGSSTAADCVCNFGQRPFAYAAPSGFKALCTANLPEPTILKGSSVMDVALYTGNGGTPQTISSLNFEPDLLWFANRTTGGYINPLIDQVRGITKYLQTYSTNAESTNANMVTATTSTGFTVGSSPQVNDTSQAMVAWCWDAATSNATNTSGTITSTVRANISAGFSIVGFTGTGTTGTVGHGLGVSPAFIIGKNRDSGSFAWRVYHSSLGGTKTLYLNLTNAAATDNDPWNDTNPSSTTISLLGGGALNRSAQNTILYCFAPVAGYSAFGLYSGNGSTDGPFQWCGFRPRWILHKSTASESFSSWHIYDTARDPSNPVDLELYPNLSNAEGNIPGGDFDILSNGFKVRTNYSGGWNTSSTDYVWAAFAENPFSIARAR